jgi:hypothetical protein
MMNERAFSSVSAVTVSVDPSGTIAVRTHGPLSLSDLKNSIAVSRSQIA